jgi:alpha-tubulin suppressor-like RCC1 family protein
VSAWSGLVIQGVVTVRSFLPAVVSAGLVAGLLLTGPAVSLVAAPGSASLFTPLSPTRVLDTRTGPGAVGPAKTITLNLATRLPAGATAVVLNVTGVASAATFVTAFPSDTGRPVVSNLNLSKGETRANLVTVAVGVNRAVNLYNQVGNTHLIVDMAGYYATGAGSRFTARQPERVLSTRVGPNTAAVVDLSTRVPASATAVVVNVTGSYPTNETYLTAWPTGTTRPLASTVNLMPGRTNPNLATVALGAGRQISVYNAVGTIDVLVDLAGFYSPEFGAAFVPVTPSRVFDTRDGTGTGSVGARPIGQLSDEAVQPGAVMPADAVAAVVNVTGIAPTAITFVSAWQRLWEPEPTTSSLNLLAGQVSANLVVVPTRGEHPGGRFSLFNKVGNINVAADLAGYFVVEPAPCTTDCGYAWGYNGGTAGTGTTTTTARPTQVRGPSAVTQLSSRLAVRSDGTVVAWGDNRYGQLGNGWTGGESPTPVRVAGLTDVVAVADTPQTGLALRSDGTVWAWGSNETGLIGAPAQPDSSVPVRLPDLSGITAIAVGDATAYALRSDGTVMAWGRNDVGQLGDGSAVTDSWRPVRVSNLTGVTAITAGFLTAAAIRTDGTVWTWGDNLVGQLGNGDTEPLSRVPVQVSGLTGAIDVALDSQHGYAVRSDGTVSAWGDNTLGGLGNGVECATDCVSAVPVRVSNLTGVTDVAATGGAGLARTAAGTVFAWGANTFGEFGAPTPDHSTVPRQVPGLAGVTAVEAGYLGGRAIR